MSHPTFEIFEIRKRYKNRPKIAILNDILSLVVLAMALYILASPLAPNASLYINKYVNELSSQYLADQAATADLQPIPTENTLVIPQIEVAGVVHEGESVDTLNLGIWHRPLTSTPDKGGNTVLIAHRFLYQSGPNTFYHLDKLLIGDEFALFWEGKEYDYKVFDISIVEPTAVEIENNTTDPILTLYTCTPLWTSAQRLVIKAKPVNT